MDLRRLNVGEPVAENERQQLDTYFLETDSYFRALDGPTTLVIGRRGTGKTAILYAISGGLARDRRNHVCVIKPAGYEIDGLVQVLQDVIQRSERGYLIASLWKFLIYTELARSVFNSISSRPSEEPLTEDEARFVGYVTDHNEIIDQPFSERLNRIVASLLGKLDSEDSSTQRSRISELLHAQLLGELGGLLRTLLDRHEKVRILIDNLDGPWGPGHHLGYLSELIWGLIEVTDDVVQDFQRSDSRTNSVKLGISIFLRSDIFSFIQPLAPEQDKLPITRIVWDHGQLIRLLNQRLEQSVPRDFDSDDVWDSLFPQHVVGLPPWDFIAQTTLPRPRDVIFVIKEAMARAINLGHPTVEAQDLIDARDKYSEYIFNSILAEDDPDKGSMEAVLYEFAGCQKDMFRSEVEHRISRGVADPIEIPFYLDLLCDVNFLGIETVDGFSYPLHEGERRSLRRVAESRAAQDSGSEEIFQINAAFHRVLQID